MTGPGSMRRRILAAARFGLGAVMLAFVPAVIAAGPPVGSEPVAQVDYGLSTAKRANCLGATSGTVTAGRATAVPRYRYAARP